MHTCDSTKTVSVTALPPNHPSISISNTKIINMKVYHGRCLGSEISRLFSVDHGKVNNKSIEPTMQIAPPNLDGNDFNIA